MKRNYKAFKTEYEQLVRTYDQCYQSGNSDRCWELAMSLDQLLYENGINALEIKTK